MFIMAKVRNISEQVKQDNLQGAKLYARSLAYGLTHWKCLTCGFFKGPSGSRYCPSCWKRMHPYV